MVLDISGYFRETIRQDIRQARERFSGQQLRQELARLQRRLDSVELLSPDIIMNLLLSYRDVQVCGDPRDHGIVFNSSTQVVASGRARV